MTREEALEYWKYKYDSAIMHNDIHYDTQECKQHEEYVKALEMAIKSLEAWEKIRKEIASDGQSDINAKYVLNLIDKHLTEVSE